MNEETPVAPDAAPKRTGLKSILYFLKLFVGKAGCIHCHNTPLFSDDDFHVIGLHIDTALSPHSDPNEAGDPTFTQPGPPDALNALSVDPSTGLVTWDTTGARISSDPNERFGNYSTQITIEDLDPNGVPKSKTAVDFFIEVIKPPPTSPHFDFPPTPLSGTKKSVVVGDYLCFDLQASDPDPGDIVLVLGANGKVGQAAIQIATMRGATVFGVERTREDYIGHANSEVRMIDASTEDIGSVVRSEGGRGGANIVFNTVGSPYFEAACKAMAVLGRQVFISTVERSIPFDIFAFYRGRHSFFGVAFSEQKLLSLGYGFEQATHARSRPVHAPVLKGESISVP